MESLKKFDREDGFTLIELIVVMIIIGILVLLATPRFLNYIEKARYTRIINDIRAVETVSIPEMVHNKFPLGTEEEETDLRYAANDQKAYKKDGLIVKGTLNSKFKPTVVNISESELADLSNGYYKLDKSKFVKKETRTRLNGDFYINKDGEVIYVDSKSASGEFNETKEEVELFTYKSDDKDSRDAGIITGLNTDHEYWEKEENKLKDIEITGRNYDGYKMPEIPESRVMDDGRRIPIVEIADHAFSNYFYDLGVLVGEDFIAGEYLENIGKEAFYSYFGEYNYHSPIFYRGRFEAGNSLKYIGGNAFYNNKFTRSFDSKNIETIGEYAFVGNKFTGNFIAGDSLETIGDYAFYNNKFTGKFDSKNIETIGKRTFFGNEFTGEFDSKNIETIGDYAFFHNSFDGNFISGKALKIIGENAFGFNEFIGDFNSKSIQTIEQGAFRDNKFNKFITGEALKYIGPNAFAYNNFTGKFNSKNIETIGNYAFYDNKFNGEFIRGEALKAIGEDAFFGSNFTNQDQLGNI